MNDAFSGKYGRLWRAADGGEAALAEGTFRLHLRPLPDANKAEVVVATINISSADSAIVRLR